MRQLAGVSGAALIVPVATLGAVIALAFAGGVARIGSLGQAFSGPRLPTSSSPAAPNGGRVSSVPLNRRNRGRAASSSPVLLAGATVGSVVSSSSGGAPVRGHRSRGGTAPHSRSIISGDSFAVGHTKQQVGATVSQTVPVPGSIPSQAGHTRQEVSVIRRSDGHPHQELGERVHRALPVAPHESRGTAAPVGDSGHGQGVHSWHGSPTTPGPRGASGHGPPGASGHGPPGASGHGPPEASGHGPPGASGHGPPGASGDGPPGASGHGPPGASGHGPPGASGHGPPGASGDARGIESSHRSPGTPGSSGHPGGAHAVHPSHASRGRQIR